MNTGGFSNALDHQVPRFNGNPFAEADALPLTEDQLELLIEASGKDWCSATSRPSPSFRARYR